MKNILSVLLILMLLGQNLVFAESSNEFKPNFISCAENNSTEFRNSIDIEREPVKLNSYLKKNYSGFVYTIINKQEHPIKISDVSRFYPPELAISRFKNSRTKKRFPGNMEGFIIVLICPLAIVAYNPQDADINPYYDLYLAPIINTAFAPYLSYKDAKDDKKANFESLSFNEKIEEVTLNTSEIEKFTVLTSNKKRYSWANDNIQFDITDLKTNQKYVIYK